VEVYIHVFFDFGTRFRWVVSLTHRPLYPQGKSPPYPMDRRLGGPLSRSGRGGEEKNSQDLPGLEPPIIQPVAQRYTTELSYLCPFAENTRAAYSEVCISPRILCYTHWSQKNWPEARLKEHFCCFKLGVILLLTVRQSVRLGFEPPFGTHSCMFASLDFWLLSVVGRPPCVRYVFFFIILLSFFLSFVPFCVFSHTYIYMNVYPKVSRLSR
jgi:hypothetical protein